MLAALLAVGLISFRRTRALRHGERPPDRPLPGPRSRTSPTTRLAGAAGVLVAGLAAVGGPRSSPLATLVPFAWGGLIAVTGIAGRVVGIEVRDQALTIRYAARPAFVLPWSELHRLRPPATALGGWRLASARGARTLMPSDLLGNEGVLGSAILRAGLAFDGRCWRTPRDHAAAA
ncbi:MAG TPA: hypothetical protein VEN82_05160 [Actinomycetota bacterium]|nr:hypothetical protein [Actinomycetota bacterium]